MLRADEPGGPVISAAKRCSGAAVRRGWRVEAETRSEGLGLGWNGGAVARSRGTVLYCRGPGLGFALAGAGRPLVGRLGRAVLGRSPAGYTGRLSGLVGLAVSGRAVPGPAGLG